jgi:hypothetical protein
VDTR